MANFFSKEKLHERRLNLYNKGKNDVEIAQAEGSTKTVIRHWRKINNLPSTYRQRGNKNSVGNVGGNTRESDKVDKRSNAWIFKPQLEPRAQRTTEELFVNPIFQREGNKILVDRVDELLGVGA